MAPKLRLPRRTMTLAFDLFAHARGSVVAPAGCGKTQAIVDALKTYDGLPVLILTHTNAGVGALRERLKAAAIPKSRIRLATLDGWAMRLVASFPGLSGVVLDKAGTIDYPAIRRGALKILGSNGLDAPLKASYARLIVDEHQDCSIDQHALTVALAGRLPTVVLGDPLQRIFDFKPGELPDWDGVVATDFPVVATFSTPWRWNNAGEPDFGAWVLDARTRLLAGGSLDLSSAPPNVKWVKKGSDAAGIPLVQRGAVAAVKPGPKEGLLVIGDSRSRDSRSKFARGAAGMNVVEPVDMGEMIDAAGAIERSEGVKRLGATLNFAKATMTGVDIEAMATRLTSLAKGSARSPATVGETACLATLADDGYAAMATVLEALPQENRRVFRRQMHAGMIEALKRAAARPGLGLAEAAVAVREQYRAVGRALPTRAVGSTLLLKGLEAEHAVILDADAMNPRHLYVALSRASRSVTVISSAQILTPK